MSAGTISGSGHELGFLKDDCVFHGDHAWRIEGLPLEEGRALIDELNGRAIDEQQDCTHDSLAGGPILWDNRCMLHKAEPYDTVTEVRVLRRRTVTGEVPIWWPGHLIDVDRHGQD